MILELMRNRRSVRQFTPEPLPDSILLKLAEAGMTAPSAGNKQPWRFLIVKTASVIEAAASAVNEARNRLIDLLSDDMRKDFETYSTHFIHFRNAPALMVPLYRVFSGLSRSLNEKATEDDHRFLKAMEHHNSLVSVSLTIQNILLMSEETGIGACCMTGPLIAGNQLARCFHVPDGWEIAAIIALGYPADIPENPGRKALQSMIKWL